MTLRGFKLLDLIFAKKHTDWYFLMKLRKSSRFKIMALELNHKERKGGITQRTQRRIYALLAIEFTKIEPHKGHKEFSISLLYFYSVIISLCS